ncbi:MAG: hypothetical protein LBT71_00315 [Azoarcus sp.]|nr:hypothetical protein [Azoarcus sp.]
MRVVEDDASNRIVLVDLGYEGTETTVSCLYESVFDSNAWAISVLVLVALSGLFWWMASRKKNKKVRDSTG